MKISSLRAILHTLNHNKIRYLIAGGVAVKNVHVISIPTLIKMKETAGRDRDKDDIQHLHWILEKCENQCENNDKK